MSKNPQFNYSAFCLSGFKKTYPVLLDFDPEIVTSWLYYTVSAFSGRERSLSAGAEDDIRCLIAAAAGVELEVCAAREIKDALRARLRRAWLENDHSTIFKVAFSFERAASMVSIDLTTVDWIDPYRILDEEEGIDIPEAVEKWVEVLCEPEQPRSVIGNRARKKLRRKPAERAVKSLFEGER